VNIQANSAKILLNLYTGDFRKNRFFSYKGADFFAQTAYCKEQLIYFDNHKLKEVCAGLYFAAVTNKFKKIMD
jgi:hypothetical protein